MKKPFKRIFAFILAVAMTASLLVVSASAATVANVGALWDGYTAGTGTFTVTSSSRVFVVGKSAPTGDLLQTAQLIQRELRAQFNDLVWGDVSWAKTGDIVLKIDSSAVTVADGYKLNVTGTTATVTAKDTDGLIYGANNLMKCFRAVGGKSISGFTGYDSPDTKQRVVMLDTGRKYYTAEWVKNFIRQMSWMGYNALEIHFSEDGGFRADLWDPAYYKGEFQPENDFSWLCGSYVQSWVKDPYRDDPNAGDYLTTEELVEICEVAKEYHIEIIPSFDSPAHMDYITWKFEQYHTAYKNKNGDGFEFTYGDTTYNSKSSHGCINYTGTTGASSPTWPYYTTIDITDGSMAKAFVFALYEDMADFFKEYAGSENFNIGADEVNLSSSYGPKWSYSQFPGYVKDLNSVLKSKGYTVRMFNDFIGSTTYNQSNSKAVYDFDGDIEIVYWNSDFNPNTGRWTDPTWHVKFFWENNTGTYHNWGDGGRTMYNAIQTNTYYVLREGTSGDNRDARDPNNRNWTFYHTNAEAIFNEWYPADISEKGVYAEDAADVPADQLGGAYFLIWNDYAALNTEEEVWTGALDCWDEDRYYYLFDIMAANIMKMWNSDINKSTVSYSYSLDNHVQTATYNGKVTYKQFVEVSSKFGWFPGFTSCSAAAELPVAATTAVPAVDFSALQVSKVTPAEDYTANSYAAYESAYNAAVALQQNNAATAADVKAAADALAAATAALVDRSALGKALADTDKISNDEGVYTDSSYAAYEEIWANAQAVYEDANATADQISAEVTKLQNAASVLEEKQISGAEDAHMAVELLNGNTVRKGKVLALRVTTLADATSLKLAGVSLTAVACGEQTLGEDQVKLWLVEIPMNETGDRTYMIGAYTDDGTLVGKETVSVTVKGE